MSAISKVILIGAASGALFVFSPGSFFILAVSLLSVQAIRHVSRGAERNFLATLFISGLALRIVLATTAVSLAALGGHTLNYSSRGCPDYSAPYIFDDDGYITLRAWFTAMDWSDEPMSAYTEKAIIKNTYGFTGFIYVLALFFKAFGWSPVSSRFINCLLGAWTAVLIYFALKPIFNKPSAKLAAALAAFFPSLVLWSMTNLKETSLIFVFCLLLFSLALFQKTQKAPYLCLTLVSALLIAFIRSFSFGPEFAVVASCVAGIYIFCLYVIRLPSRKKAAVFASLLIVVSVLVFIGRDKIFTILEYALQKLTIWHKALFFAERGICYRLMPYDFYVTPQVLNTAGAFKMFARGWFHMMFEPLPWRIQSVSMMFAFPQMLVWYFLIPFAILGIVVLARRRLKESAALIAYFFVLGSILAITGSNVGTVFRHRDINTPFFLMLSSVGVISAFGGFKDDKTDR